MLDVVLTVADKLLDRFFPDPVKRQEAALKILELQQSGDLAIIASQVELNKIEASSKSLFVSGWRPAVGWVCVAAIAVQLVLGPMLVWITKLFGHPIDMLVLDVSLLTTLLLGMLGLGGMRTVEKLSGVASK